MLVIAEVGGVAGVGQWVAQEIEQNFPVAGKVEGRYMGPFCGHPIFRLLRPLKNLLAASIG